MSGDGYREFLDLLRRLKRAKIHYTLFQAREEALMIQVTVPGQRWEIELVDYGHRFQWEVERFVSSGRIEDEAALEELFDKFSD
jgi:hypothetical protein